MCQLAATLILIISLTAPARAYILPAESLARLVAESRHNAGIKDASLQLTSDMAGHDHLIDERLYLKRPERSRLIQQDDTTWVAVDREGSCAAGEEKALKPVPGPSSNLLPALLMPRGTGVEEIAARLLHSMQAVGIDTHVVTLGRLNETVAYVLGAHAWEKDKPQVWLDKTSLLPLRWITTKKVDNAQPAILETRLIDYGMGPGGTGLPRLIEDYQDGKLVRRAEIIAAQFNQDLPETLFEWGPRRR